MNKLLKNALNWDDRFVIERAWLAWLPRDYHLIWVILIWNVMDGCIKMNCSD